MPPGFPADLLHLFRSLAGPDFCLIFAPLKGYDEPEILVT
jgi:hypothetical protein